MSSEDYIIKCSIAPPCVVYIKEKAIDNAFTIEFEKVPLKYAKQYLKNWNQETFLFKEEDAKAGIYIRLSLGEGINDLCTIQQASNTTFTTITGEGWTMTWSDPNACFIVTPPNDFDFPDTYRASFHSNAFYTTAKEGSTTLEAYFVNFTDVKTKIVAVNLYKRYPVDIEYFTASPDTVAIGQMTTLSWRVLNAQKCYITGVGQVETDGSRAVTVTGPTKFELSAENDMGMTERAALEVGCEKPTIRLWSDSLYYHKGDSITLYWESTSATSVQIAPSLGQVQTSGQATIFPESDTYTATANGYDGIRPYAAMTALQLEKTPWVKKGQTTGVDLSKEVQNVDRRVWAYGGNSYLFCDLTLYRSANLLNWEEVSKLELDLNMTLNAYSTTVAGATFIVMGIIKKDSKFIQVASYDFNKKVWTISDAIADLGNTGGQLTNRSGTSYYGALSKPLLMFYTPEAVFEGKWGMSLYYKDKEMDTYDISSLRDNLYAAVHETTNGFVKVNQMGGNGWIDMGTTNKIVEGWFSMISTKGVMYLLTADWMINLDDFKSASPFQPPLEADYRPWTGSMNNIPFLMTKEGILWCYEV
ncbi:hypothetical protein [Fusibacter sp. 3D3]|uniref:hypothetical protein n=1 Tax=Fusibacter sp. 3D3 TaxID=1048380 RepID=UPI000853570B|nr:hypothetical protein [Fusibacter sp. 3D3]GAU76009.1 odd Oz/ten-m homolog 4 [Fusibacter sp. 3D3]